MIFGYKTYIMSSNEFICGLFAGITSACIFNPIDKIIFASCIQGQSLLSANTYKDLFKGSLNNIGTRLITSGLYFSYIDSLSHNTDCKITIAAVTALLCSVTNPLQLVKYRSWYLNCSNTYAYQSIIASGGHRAMSIGIVPLIIRDFTFNYVYLSGKINDNHLHNLSVICAGVVITSPINLVRNRKYADGASYRNIIKDFRFKQLGLGMSVGRTCLCFYSSQIIYDCFKSSLSVLF